MVTFYRFIKTTDPFLIINGTHCLLLCAWLNCCGSYACSVSADSVTVCRCLLPALSFYTELVSSIRINNGDYVVFFYCCWERAREREGADWKNTALHLICRIFSSFLWHVQTWSEILLLCQYNYQQIVFIVCFFFFLRTTPVMQKKLAGHRISQWRVAADMRDLCCPHMLCVPGVVTHCLFFFFICFYLRKGLWLFFHHFCWLIIFEIPGLIADHNFNLAFEIPSL